MALKPFNSEGGFGIDFDNLIIRPDGGIQTTALEVDGAVDLGEVGNLSITGGALGRFLQTDGEGNISWQLAGSMGNTVYMSKDGSDEDNDGTSWSSSVSTFEKALEIAETKSGEMPGIPVLIEVGPGVYETEGHLDMPDNTMIRAPHRAVVIRPKAGFEERNVFRMGSGCFIEGPIFEDFRLDSLQNPTEGFAISFRPGALIRRAPYAHKIAVRSTPTWTKVAPPLDRANANPLVPRGAGVVLADGLVCSPSSIYPNIMTWGATPVSHNGIGYCAKNGALINAVNAISIWAHKHFLALAGGQIILSSCSTQFGDFTMVSDGKRDIISPYKADIEFVANTTDANLIEDNTQQIIDDLLDALIAEQLDTEDAERIAGLVLLALYWTILTADETPMLDLARSFFDTQGNFIFSGSQETAFLFAFEFIKDEVNGLGITQTSQDIVTEVIDRLVETITDPVKIAEPSTITAIGHTWTAIMAGVALTKIPPARNATTIQESIIERNQGVVIASGQDDQGSALFIGGLEINADTGELSGPPFDQAVNRIATRASIARSF
jgi:hypothetical protein